MTIININHEIKKREQQLLNLGQDAKTDSQLLGLRKQRITVALAGESRGMTREAMRSNLIELKKNPTVNAVEIQERSKFLRLVDSFYNKDGVMGSHISVRYS